MSDLSGPHQILSREARARSLQAEAGEGFENDSGEVVPVADDVGEGADEEGLLDEPRDDVVVSAPAPEQRGERHIDHYERGRNEGDLATKQSEAAVDIGGEDPQEIVDDA